LDKWRLIFTDVSLADSQVLVSPYILIIIHFDGRFRRDTQVSWFHLHFIPPPVPEGISGAGFFYRLDVLPVTQPTVSVH